MELITLSSKFAISDAREAFIDGLFPLKHNRPHLFKDKRTIFLTSRVHPGETPASFVLEGIMKMLCEEGNE